MLLLWFPEKEEMVGRPTSRVSRVLVSGPLAGFVEAYEAELKVRGYTPRSAVSKLRQVGRLSRWLERNGLSAGELNRDRVEEFLAFQRGTGRSRSQWSRRALVCLLDVLRVEGILPAEQPPAATCPTETVLSSFERHLLAERGLAAGTAYGYVWHVRRFLEGLPAGRDLAEVTAAEVTGAVLRESSAGAVSTTQNFVAALRSFLRFCFVEGLLAVDLAPAALSVTGRRRSSLPRGISQQDAAALLGSCDRRTALGRRDYAMILLLLRLGLRRGEVASLRLEDIDWRAGELLVHGKGAREDRLPLPADVGEAIAGYLQRGRPKRDHREVFLRARAPFEPIASGTVSSSVRRACRRAGVAEVGAHRLRHTVACEMVAVGVPLPEIAQVLRHHSLQSTALYARVDVEQLRLLAAPWPGGGSR
jgi:integrase/recombinase XerD